MRLRRLFTASAGSPWYETRLRDSVLLWDLPCALSAFRAGFALSWRRGICRKLGSSDIPTLWSVDMGSALGGSSGSEPGPSSVCPMLILGLGIQLRGKALGFLARADGSGPGCSLLFS